VWADIIVSGKFVPGDDFATLEPNDFAILRLHRKVGVDYSLKVARMLSLPREEVFDRHRTLRDMKLLKRVQPVMIQYRKGVVDNKWIKHRNHTYYELTRRGALYLDYFEQNL
jgi:predicted transcriptional regulator